MPSYIYFSRRGHVESFALLVDHIVSTILSSSIPLDLEIELAPTCLSERRAAALEQVSAHLCVWQAKCGRMDEPQNVSLALAEVYQEKTSWY